MVHKCVGKGPFMIIFLPKLAKLRAALFVNVRTYKWLKEEINWERGEASWKAQEIDRFGTTTTRINQNFIQKETRDNIISHGIEMTPGEGTALEVVEPICFHGYKSYSKTPSLRSPWVFSCSVLVPCCLPRVLCICTHRSTYSCQHGR